MVTSSGSRPQPVRIANGVMLKDVCANQSVIVHADCQFAHEFMEPRRQGVEIRHPPRLARGEAAPHCEVCGEPLELRPVG